MEEGKADLGVQDRWGATPLDEAMRAGSRAVMDYLRGISAPTRKDDDRTVEFLYAASRGDTAKLRHVRPLILALPSLKSEADGGSRLRHVAIPAGHRVSMGGGGSLLHSIRINDFRHARLLFARVIVADKRWAE